MQECRKVVNIINFIRGIEPRPGRLIDLFKPVKEQMRLAKEYDLPVTWLIQYDAMTEGPFSDFLLKEARPDHEFGIWFETVRQNVEAAGIRWRGRWSWDWHTDVGFSVGYSTGEREKIIDIFVDRFRKIFGHLPQSTGSWLFDAHLLEYMHRKYGIVSSCNCKDQFGTDGYTLWGGYWANGYYPSRVNSYMPAQHVENQIPVPVFRMLGSDPLYQLDADISNGIQRVISLEPVYPEGGGSENWTNWYFSEFLRNPVLSMGYVQAGQENSFGWDAMKDGITYQFRKIAKLRDKGLIRVETLADTGRWFRKNYRTTPASSVVTLSDWKEKGHEGIWYMSAEGRMNFYVSDKKLLLRDWHVFDERIKEDHLEKVCRTHDCSYFTPSIADMVLEGSYIEFSGEGSLSDVSEAADDTLTFRHGDVKLKICGNIIEAKFKSNGTLKYMTGKADADRKGNQLRIRSYGAEIRLDIEAGSAINSENGFELTQNEQRIRLRASLG